MSRQSTHSPTVAVAFCADRHMEAPLHVAMASLLRHLNPHSSAHFYLILTGWSERKIARLHQTLDATQHIYSLHLLSPDNLSIFDRFPDLHGSRATYYRLLLPELVDEPRLLYLDSDIQVNIDIAPLFALDMHSASTGFVIDGTVAQMLDHDFQIAVGRKNSDPSFNAGVLLFNLSAWHQQHCTETVFAFAKQYGEQLPNRDQSLLNALFANHCVVLDRHFNVTVKPSTHVAQTPRNAIIHYYGSPKPWDLGARWLHNFAPDWYSALRQTALPWLARAFWLDGNTWTRLPRILNGYKAALVARLRP
jgi:lipopolysaccharide biosynthesis glycosyltransferase